MSEQTERTPRGEAAWKEQRDAIAARNEQARKAARQRRSAEDRVRAVERVAAERREMDEAVAQHPER